MYTKGHRVLHLAGVMAVVALLTGCATSQELEEVRTMAEEAHNATHRVEDKLEQVRGQAQNAADKAQQANRQAESALQQAQQAQECCQRNTKKIDRMFKKSMQK